MDQRRWTSVPTRSSDGCARAATRSLVGLAKAGRTHVPPRGRSAVRVLLGLTVVSFMAGVSAPAAIAAKPVPVKVVLTGHVASVVAKRQAKGAPLGSV